MVSMYGLVWGWVLKGDFGISNIFFVTNLIMNSGKWQEHNSEVGKDELKELEQHLKNKIEEAKMKAKEMKTSLDNQQQCFVVNSDGELVYPEFQNEINYNEQFWKTYLKNELSFSLVKDLNERTNELQDLVKEIEELQENYAAVLKLKNRKKNRRLSAEIQKKFECPYEKCYKIYGSDVSLNLHIKLKHNGGNKTDRQKLASQICASEISGLPAPEMIYNLPPDYLENFRKTYKPTDSKVAIEQ